MRELLKVGDWIRFYRNGVLVIGVVNYIREDRAIGYTYYQTDAGEVRADSVLEIR
jgi:hypothetical protein